MTLELISCDAYTLYLRKGDTLRWEHHGIHVHPRPPKGGKLSKSQCRLVDEQVSRHPTVTAHTLRNGLPVPGSIPLGEIHPALTSAEKARYEREKSLKRQGIASSVGSKNPFLVFEAIANFQDQVSGSFIISSSMTNPAYYSIQTDWMRTMLTLSVEDWLTQPSGPSETRHGFVTDGDHTFFRFGTLVATCAFSLDMNKWVPVLYTWVMRQDTLHFRAHFRTLNKCIIEASGPRFDMRMLSGVIILLLVWRTILMLIFFRFSIFHKLSVLHMRKNSQIPFFRHVLDGPHSPLQRRMQSVTNYV